MMGKPSTLSGQSIHVRSHHIFMTIYAKLWPKVIHGYKKYIGRRRIGFVFIAGYQEIKEGQPDKDRPFMG